MCTLMCLIQRLGIAEAEAVSTFLNNNNVYIYCMIQV